MNRYASSNSSPASAEGACGDGSLSRLGGVGDGGDDEAVGADAIEDGIRSAADDEFTDAGFRADAAEVGMNSQSFHDGNDAGGQAFGGVRLVQGNEGTNFLEAGQSQGRPDDLERAMLFLQVGSQPRERGRGDSSAWALPQTHFGGGNSRSVPQETSHASMSSSPTYCPHFTCPPACPISASPRPCP